MKEELKKFIQNLITNKGITLYDESATKQGIILPLLSILEWNIFNIEEVKPEHSVGGKSVDYALRVENVNKVFLEVKKIGEDLEKHQEQLLNYSFQEGVELAALTNGITWWFYLPLHKGSWEQRRFYTIDLSQQEPGEVVQKFIDFLSKNNIITGEAIQNAEAIYKNQERQTKIEKALPEAWNEIVSETNELLIDLISKTTEKLCGYRPGSEIVKKFLSKHKDHLFISKPSSIEPRDKTSIEPRDKKAKKGERTPRQEFRIPILKALTKLGGKGNVKDILKEVEIEMKGILKPVDYEKLPSGNMIRWQNTAEWERYFMVKDGLLCSDSPIGIWEITEKGKKFLEDWRKKRI